MDGDGLLVFLNAAITLMLCLTLLQGFHCRSSIPHARFYSAGESSAHGLLSLFLTPFMLSSRTRKRGLILFIASASDHDGLKLLEAPSVSSLCTKLQENPRKLKACVYNRTGQRYPLLAGRPAGAETGGCARVCARTADLPMAILVHMCNSTSEQVARREG